MPYTRRVLHYSPGPSDFVSEISTRAIAGAWFELHRHGGCGAGELKLRDEFSDRNLIGIGDWIAFEYDTGDRWYLGRVASREATSPAGTTYRLEGMGVELGEVFPGGFGRNVADGIPPHRYARTDLFPNDPDWASETVDAVSTPQDLVLLLMQQYVVPRSDILLDPLKIEAPLEPASITSLKFRGEESVRSVIKEASIRAQNASWGVDETGTFFFLKPPTTLAATFREGSDLISLEETLDRETIFNRVVLTGGYIYDAPLNSNVIAQGFYRWRGNYLQPASRDQYGDRRIRIWVPWIRTVDDSREFMREFFRVYAQPATRYLVEVGNQSSLPRPWTGTVRLEDKNGNELVTRPIDTIRVQFDQSPRFRMEIGPADPRIHWPEPPQDERWELPKNGSPPFGGDIVTFSLQSSSGGFSNTSFDQISSSSSVGSAGSSMLSGSGGSGSGPASSGTSGSGSASGSGSGSSGSGSVSSGSGSGSGSSASGSGSGSSGSLSSGLSGSSSSGTGCVLWETFTDVDRLLTGHVADTGQSWLTTGGFTSLSIVNNQEQNPSGSGKSNHINTGLLIGDDRSGTADFKTGDNISLGNMGITLSHNGAQLYWWLIGNPQGNNVQILEETSSGQFVRATTAKTYSPNTLYAAEFSFIGTTIQLTVGGTTASYGAATIRYGVYDGLRSDQNTSPPTQPHTIDNLCIKKV